jgi:hypothetical protein
MMKGQTSGEMVINNYTPVIQSDARASPLRNNNTISMVDARTLGGRKTLHDMHTIHRSAVSNVSSVVGMQMKPPHAHIGNCKGNRIDFGKDKKHRKMYRISRKAI